MFKRSGGAVGNPRAEGSDFALLTLGQEIPRSFLEMDQFLSKADQSAHYVSRSLRRDIEALFMSSEADSIIYDLYILCL